MSSSFRACVLSGRRALVTGGCGGIGIVIANAVDDIRRRTGVSASGLVCDMSDPSAAAASVRAVMSADGPFDIVVHCAAHNRNEVLLRATADELIRHFTVNCAAVAQITAAVVKPLIARSQSASIITIGSAIADGGVVGAAAYAASKSAVASLNRSMAAEYGRYNIRCNIILSGLIRTAMTEGIDTSSWSAATALGRIGTAEDIADAVIFLCSDASRFITGHALVVDGGLKRR